MILDVSSLHIIFFIHKNQFFLTEGRNIHENMHFWEFLLRFHENMFFEKSYPLIQKIWINMKNEKEIFAWASNLGVHSQGCKQE